MIVCVECGFEGDQNKTGALEEQGEGGGCTSNIREAYYSEILCRIQCAIEDCAEFEHT